MLSGLVKAIAHWVRNSRTGLPFFFLNIPHPLLSKCMQRMRKRRNWTSSIFFSDGRKFRRRCTNVNYTMCENFGRKYLTQCSETFTPSVPVCLPCLVLLCLVYIKDCYIWVYSSSSCSSFLVPPRCVHPDRYRHQSVILLLIIYLSNHII